MRPKITLLILCFSSIAFTQKKPLTIKDFDQWKHLENVIISTNGKYVGYNQVPQVGNSILVLHQIAEGKVDSLKRVSNYNFTFDGKFLVATLVPDYEAIRQLKLKKEKKENYPKDSLFLVNTKTYEHEFIALVKSWKIPKTNGEWLAYLKEEAPKIAEPKIEEPAEPTEPKEEKLPAIDEEKKKSDKKFEDTRTLVLLNLKTLEKTEYAHVKDYGFSDNGKLMYFYTLGDSSLENGVYALQTQIKQLNKVAVTGKTFTKICTDTTGTAMAFVYAEKGEKRKNKAYQLLHYSVAKNSILNKLDTQKLAIGMRISENANIRFTENGQRLFFGIYEKEKKYPNDTTILEEEKAVLDIWSYIDGRLQPQQLFEQKDDTKRSIEYFLDTKTGKITQVGHHLFSQENVAEKQEGDFVLISDALPYFRERSWAYPWARDIYLKNLKKGSEEKLFTKFLGSVGISPGGKYLYWFNQEEGLWWLMDLKTNKRTCLTTFNKDAFIDLTDDHPALPESYGIGGWLENDERLLINDQYGVWFFDPTGKEKPWRYGNKPILKIRVRVEKTNKEHFLAKNEAIWFEYFNTKTKQKNLAFFYFDKHETTALSKEENQAYFAFAQRNDKGNRYLFTIEKSGMYPELFYQNEQGQFVQLSKTNPQQDKYKWYKTQLLDYLSADGDSLQGILYSPENFDPSKKYPLIVYFYEKMSDYINYYQEPRPSYSTISRSFYCSNDYFVFVPDIVYQDGEPGQSAFNCIVPGVLSLLKDQPNIDQKRMALQGQSWGGYQTAFLITRTDLFACGMAGAPVSNMTSAYGGIRWGSGYNRAFQYEHGQSRIGGSLWEKPFEYIENSPLFFANRVNTPLLIMHNDKDGSVPWYQGIEYYTALRRLDKPVWLLVYNNEDHNLTKRPNRIDLSYRMFGFFNYYLKGEEIPQWMEYGIPAMDKGKYPGY